MVTAMRWSYDNEAQLKEPPVSGGGIINVVMKP